MPIPQFIMFTKIQQFRQNNKSFQTYTLRFSFLNLNLFAFEHIYEPSVSTSVSVWRNSQWNCRQN